MPNDDSVSQWIDGLKAGDEAAARQLWERYYGRLVGLAYKKLRAGHRRAADEEDIVLSAFHSFCQRARRNQFPDLRDRDDLWRLIVCITERKVCDQVRADRRQKRGGGDVAGESVFLQAGDASGIGGIQQVAGHEPTPEFAAETAEAIERLLRILDDDELRLIAARKLEGFSNAEIAAQLGRSIPTVERRLKLIRGIWEKDAGCE